MKFLNFLSQNLKKIKENQLYRERKIVKNLIDFSSNDYLGLKNNEKTKKKLCENIENLLLGSGASTHVSGYTEIQQELEKFLAKFKETESCIVVGSGYMANVGLIAALATDEDIIFSDELNHASIIDGIRLSKAKKVIYKHCDINDLENKLKNSNSKGIKYIITDGVFSMEGDVSPLDKIYYLCEKYDAVLIVDDAHATGVVGEGKGSIFYFNLKPSDRIIQMGTLSKAVGSYGAYICGSQLLIDYLVNKMRTAIFTTALSPIQNFISLENLKILVSEPERRNYILKYSKYVAENLKNLGYEIKYYQTPIISLITKTPEKALKLRDKLKEKGFFIQAIRPPTVPEGQSRLRITINYNHSKIDFDNLLNAFYDLKGELL